LRYDHQLQVYCLPVELGFEAFKIRATFACKAGIALSAMAFLICNAGRSGLKVE
jgi:hypothetical protein